MTKMVGIKEAANATGLSEWELGRGARAGEYPCIKIGEGRGKYLFNVELLNETLHERALANMTREREPAYATHYGIRKVM